MTQPSLGYDTWLLAVVALYNTDPESSPALRSLLASVQEVGNPPRVVLFDNSPRGEKYECLPGFVRYWPAMRNEGVAGAYNFALRMAEREGASWLLTLDQDTDLPTDFLGRLHKLVPERAGDDRIAAIVPQLRQGEKVLSPYRLFPWGIRILSHGFEGIAAGEIHALNSGSLFRVEALREIGGFDPRFWLDYQDYSVFHRFHRLGRKVWVAGNVCLRHDLSLLSTQESPSSERFGNFLQAESAFWDLNGKIFSGPALTARLACRWWRQRRRGVDASIRRLTLAAVRHRLFRSKTHRIRAWKEEMNQRLRDCARQDHGWRPAVSVCVATYNGERYIAAQLRSILIQLRECDEVIVVDDASTDCTREAVESLGDSRIRLILQATNRGVLRTFERAIAEAHGDILFLADQDDLWAPGKVSAMVRGFEENPEVNIVVSDAALIDDNNQIIGKSYYAIRGSFRPGVLSNVVRCKFLGCTMAFRKRLRRNILPFPLKADILHDVWIGVVNSLSGGQTLYIDEPLVLYRRHSGNATGVRPLSLGKRIRIRLDLCRSLIRQWPGLQRGGL